MVTRGPREAITCRYYGNMAYCCSLTFITTDTIQLEFEVKVSQAVSTPNSVEAVGPLSVIKRDVLTTISRGRWEVAKAAEYTIQTNTPRGKLASPCPKAHKLTKYIPT